MELKHIAIAVNCPEDIDEFYRGILGFTLYRQFVLNANLSESIFGLNKELDVYQIKNDSTMLELFITDNQCRTGVSHICLSVDSRTEFLEDIRAHHYECIIKEHNGHDVVFVKDRSGNMFEIKKT
ncbi:MAG: VOC family protein [candidate division WOR-3 bacterium]|nr:VOC family protein [candidate division WOR-3 bacterium]